MIYKFVLEILSHLLQVVVMSIPVGGSVVHSPVVLPAIDDSVLIALIGPTSEGPPLLTQSLSCHWPERRLMGQLVYESFLFVCSSE